MKTCPKCGKEGSFYIGSYTSAYCVSCTKAYQKERRIARGDEFKQKRNTYNRRYYHENAAYRVKQQEYAKNRVIDHEKRKTYAKTYRNKHKRVPPTNAVLVNEAARLLGISRQYVHILLKKGELEAHIIEGLRTVYVTLESIESKINHDFNAD